MGMGNSFETITVLQYRLKAAQEEADHLFSMYGYPTIHEIFRR